MNPVEIEQAITDLAAVPFDPGEFPYAFLEAFGNKTTTIKRLKSGNTNKSDLGGVLQTSNIHLLVCEAGKVGEGLNALRQSPATARAKTKFILATDGQNFEAENLASGETVACAFADFPDHFGFFLPLAGISTVAQISENAFDIRATSRLNRLYLELIKDNPAWGTARRHEMNHFMARLIFCFFAEDTDIFQGKGRFTNTIAQMGAGNADTSEIIATIFAAMNLRQGEHEAAGIPRWAQGFPYVNGALFFPGTPTPSSAFSTTPAPGWRSRGYIPHYDDRPLIQHITFRLSDSLPQEKLQQLNKQLGAPTPSSVLFSAQNSAKKRKEIEEWLDAGIGCCALAHPEAAAIVQKTLLHADGDQYRLLAWCIMPNHVHVLIEPKTSLSTIVQAWKSVSARRILALNEEFSLGIPDPKQLWMREYWDRYIRDDHHYQACIDYIHQNPVKANLCRDAVSWKWSSANASVGTLYKHADEGVGVPRMSAPSVPRFSRIARSYLLHVGNLDWTKINPDIFGSMIQAVADEGERGQLGMHYTSVPNILKVLNPLFLDELRARLSEAGDNPRTLLNLRKRIARIRVFDPACGSGNFLVIAYKELRAIEFEINQRRGEADRASEIPLTNFRGIEINDFPAEIARLALVIAQYQCDERYRGLRLALLEFLPLKNENWITCGNALRLDWLSVCPPTGTGVKLRGDDLFLGMLGALTPSSAWTGYADEGVGAPRMSAPSDIDFANEGGETYICGNPPYLGSTWQSEEQKADLGAIFDKRVKNWKSLDYVAGWFMKAADYITHTPSTAAFVSTNSICQGQQVPILWPEIFASGCEIVFAHTSFKWANLASHNAGVTVAIIGISNQMQAKRLFSLDETGQTLEKHCEQINAYLVAGEQVIVDKANQPLGEQSEMSFGNKPVDGGHLLLSRAEVDALGLSAEQQARFIRRIYGSAEFIRGLERYCLWIEDADLPEAQQIPAIAQRIEGVRQMRLASRDKGAQAMAERAHQFREMNTGTETVMVVPRVSSENRDFLPVGILEGGTIIGDRNFALYDAPLWNMALIASRLHWVWIGTVCVRLEMRFSYSNTLGWNTFPLPTLTEKNKADLTRCAEDILLAREAHFPATIADLYAPDAMPENLRMAHERNDEVLERIYLGRRFKNDSERLEKLFALYTQMAAKPAKKGKAK